MIKAIMYWKTWNGNWIVFMVNSFLLFVTSEGANGCPAGSLDCFPSCEHCLGGPAFCDAIDGHCVNGCTAGRRGYACSQTCPKGWYGTNCNYQCTQCAGTCDPVTGYCISEDCKPGWQPPMCKKRCPAYIHGKGCETVCKNCHGCFCDAVTGACDTDNPCHLENFIMNETKLLEFRDSYPVRCTNRIKNENVSDDVVPPLKLEWNEFTYVHAIPVAIAAIFVVYWFAANTVSGSWKPAESECPVVEREEKHYDYDMDHEDTNIVLKTFRGKLGKLQFGHDGAHRKRKKRRKPYGIRKDEIDIRKVPDKVTKTQKSPGVLSKLFGRKKKPENEPAEKEKGGKNAEEERKKRKPGARAPHAMLYVDFMAVLHMEGEEDAQEKDDFWEKRLQDKARFAALKPHGSKRVDFVEDQHAQHLPASGVDVPTALYDNKTLPGIEHTAPSRTMPDTAQSERGQQQDRLASEKAYGRSSAVDFALPGKRKERDQKSESSVGKASDMTSAASQAAQTSGKSKSDKKDKTR